MSARFEELHREAMGLSAQSFLARMQGQDDVANNLIQEAFEKERRVAVSVADQYDLEPTRSVLFRSAASLALECKEYREAERLLSFGLSGSPPEDIANEMRDLLEQVYFSRHLQVKDIELTTNEFQLSLVGGSVGHGFAPSKEVATRVQSVENLVFRTGQRKRGTSFSSSRKSLGKQAREEIEPYLTVPRAASYAITFRIGVQLSIDGLGLSEQIIDEIFHGITLINESNFDELRTVIQDNDYYQNFVGLVKNIAPDGQRVKMVGFTSQKGGNEQQVMLSTPRSEIIETPIDTDNDDGSGEGERIEIRGFLKFADSNRTRQGLIKIITDDFRTEQVYVSLALMSDVVRPLYESEVIANAVVAKGRKHLTSIEPA